MGKNKKAEFEISDSTKEKRKEGKKKEFQIEEDDEVEEDDEARLLARSEAWDLYCLYYGQAIRGVTALIIAKNVLRMLLFEPPEWSEDFEDLNREIHIRIGKYIFYVPMMERYQKEKVNFQKTG